jgi:hypothetical protein
MTEITIIHWKDKKQRILINGIEQFEDIQIWYNGQRRETLQQLIFNYFSGDE